MDYDTVSAEEFGASLSGIGLNILVRDVRNTCDFLNVVFGLSAHQKSADFAIMRYGAHVFQLHSDATYHSNPVLGLLPEVPPRGAGIELRLYDSDPDLAVQNATATRATILQPATDKPHGLREAYILDTD